MDYTVEISLLSNKFVSDYPDSLYPELMYKPSRPYSCLSIKTYDYTICIPFRSHIAHNNAYLFRTTRRSRQTRSGLDYSKMVLIKNPDYLDDATAVVDSDEYTETILNMTRIVNEVLSYIDTYVKHISRITLIHRREFERKYQYSTLPYFHDVLGL